MGDQRRRLGVVVLLLLMVAGGWMVLRWWSKPAVVEYANLPLLQLLSTAVSNQNLPAVEKVSVVVEQRHLDQKMSEAEYNEFFNLIRLARDGKWEVADRACFELAEAQLHRRRSVPAENAQDSHRHTHP